MSSISVISGAFTHTASSPGRHPNEMARARLRILGPQGQPLFSGLPNSYSEGTANYSGNISEKNLRVVANCGTCSWLDGRYAINFDVVDAVFITEVIEGSVAFSGSLPCSSCGGTDPPEPDGPAGDSDRGVTPPSPPPAPCLPPPFVNPPSPVPDPCGGGGSGGSSSLGFGNPTTP
jgi:hypothetical protein